MAGMVKPSHHRQHAVDGREDFVARSKEGFVVGPRAGLPAKDLVFAAAVQPPQFVFHLQARRQRGLHLARLNPGGLAHLPVHPLETVIEEHLAEIEVDEFGCHGSLNRRGKQSFFTHPG